MNSREIVSRRCPATNSYEIALKSPPASGDFFVEKQRKLSANPQNDLVEFSKYNDIAYALTAQAATQRWLAARRILADTDFRPRIQGGIAMVSLTALVLCVASAVGANDVVLLDFTAAWCGPCRTMDPIVKQLEAAGYPVRRVDFDQEQELARQLQVTRIPCFVLIANGRVVDREVGATSLERLQQMFASLQNPAGNSAQNNHPYNNSPSERMANNAAPANMQPMPSRPAASEPATSGPIVRGQSPEPRGFSLPGMSRLNTMFERQSSPTDEAPRSIDQFAPTAQPMSSTSGNGANASQTALSATVRLRVEDPTGHSLGSGTIVDQHDEEALVVTCGHIFRDSKGKGAVHVDVFSNGVPRTVPGHVIDYDLTRDIGVVAIRVSGPVQMAKVASASYQPNKGDRVFSVGCDRGANPTVIESRITAINKYKGPANIEVAGQPVDGRSGGGLFNSEGQLIGVCNAADPADREGIYAALSTVQWQLSQVGQQRLFQSDAAATPSQSLASSPLNAGQGDRSFDDKSNKSSSQPPKDFSSTGLNAQPIQNSLAATPRFPNQTVMPVANIAEAAQGMAAMGGDTEVICIVRSKSDPAGKSRVFVLDNIPPELIQQLASGAREAPPTQDLRDYTSAGNPRSPRLGSFPEANNGPIVRGQSR